MFSLYPTLIKNLDISFEKICIERCVSSRKILENEKWLMITSRSWIFVNKKKTKKEGRKKEERNIVKQIEMF